MKKSTTKSAPSSKSYWSSRRKPIKKWLFLSAPSLKMKILPKFQLRMWMSLTMKWIRSWATSTNQSFVVRFQESSCRNRTRIRKFHPWTTTCKDQNQMTSARMRSCWKSSKTSRKSISITRIKSSRKRRNNTRNPHFRKSSSTIVWKSSKI